ncbi:hypothetical protein ABBQ38_000837 [Trebouxia sp. C0009 RCD-2024]
MMGLKDWLTVSRQLPLGQNLMIPFKWWVPAHREGADYSSDNSLFDTLQAQIDAGAEFLHLPKFLMVLYQMTLLPDGPALEDIHVTTIRTFWQAVEATVAAGRLVHKVGVQDSERAVAPIAGMGVILPTFLNVMHGQDNWQGRHVSEVYGDHTSWDAPFLVDLLGKFFQITQSFSLVDLQEELARTDKIDNYNMFRAHYTNNPVTGFPPIPSQPVTLPVDKHTLHVLCFKARYERHTSTHIFEEEDIQGTIAAMLEAARLLDQDQDVRHFQKAQQTRSGKAARTYILKRNGSYGAMRQAKFSLTKSQNQQNASSEDTDVCSAMFDDGQQRETCGSGWERMEQDVWDQEQAELREVAIQVMWQSCGQPYLLQPYIPDMPSNEYRIYMFGSNAKGLPNDTAAVLTPFVVGRDMHKMGQPAKGSSLVYDDDWRHDRPYYFNHTLPYSFFSRSPIEPVTGLLNETNFNSTHVQEHTVPYFPFPIWRDESMHELLMQMARSVTEVIKAARDPGQPPGNLLRSLIRVDVAVVQQQGLAKGFINEAHHTPDCNLGMPVWLPQAHPTLPSAPVNAGLAYSTASRKANEDHSWGYVVARSLWDEMLAAKGFG